MNGQPECVASWRDGQSVKLASSGDLRPLVERIRAELKSEQGIFLIIAHPQGQTLSLGVAGDKAVLSYVSGSGDPPYQSSVGDRAASGVVILRYMGHWTEVPARKFIPLCLAVTAAEYFVDTGLLSREVAWEVE